MVGIASNRAGGYFEIGLLLRGNYSNLLVVILERVYVFSDKKPRRDIGCAKNMGRVYFKPLCYMSHQQHYLYAILIFVTESMGVCRQLVLP